MILVGQLALGEECLSRKSENSSVAFWRLQIFFRLGMNLVLLVQLFSCDNILIFAAGKTAAN